MSRQYSIIDNVICNFNNALQTVLGINTTAVRPSPAQDLPEPNLNKQKQDHVARLMRINHVGEVCAQALYQGQALTAHSSKIKNKLQQAAQEETDHLAWCQQRIHELNGRTSFLNPLWYTGSFALGAIAGFIGDKISLGFLAETEHQVEQHLTNHLQQLPNNDHKSRAILEQMRSDEIHHAQTAEQIGAVELPATIKFIMQGLSKVMTTTAYWV